VLSTNLWKSTRREKIQVIDQRVAGGSTGDEDVESVKTSVAAIEIGLVISRSIVRDDGKRVSFDGAPVHCVPATSPEHRLNNPEKINSVHHVNLKSLSTASPSKSLEDFSHFG